MVERTTSTSKWTDHEICTTMHIKMFQIAQPYGHFICCTLGWNSNVPLVFLILLEMHQAYIPMFDAFCSLNGE